MSPVLLEEALLYRTVKGDVRGLGVSHAKSKLEPFEIDSLLL